MNTRTGEIATLEHFRRTLPPDEFADFVRPINLDHLSPETRRAFAEGAKAHVGRNSSCPCGSGKKFKRCCLSAGGA